MKPTHRMADGNRVDGLSRLVLHHINDRYDLVELGVYADGSVSIGGLFSWSLDGFAEAVEAGDVVAHVHDGMRVHRFGLGDWTVAEAQSYEDRRALVTEVADAIEELNGRPDTIRRFHDATRDYARNPSPTTLDALRAALDAVPDSWGWLIDWRETDAVYRILAYDDGRTHWGRPITAREADEERAYLAEWVVETDRREAARDAETAPPASVTPVLELPEVNFAHPEPFPADPYALRNGFPLPVTVDGRTYPSLEHAFHALSILDEAGREAIAAEAFGMRVPFIAAAYPERPGWPDVRLAVMADLVRAKFRTHQDLADLLLSTGEAHILYQSLDPFWGESKHGSPHWMGRLLELVRAELALERGDFRVRVGS